MAVTTTYSASYLAESKATVLTVFYSIPIALEFLSTSLRLWAKLSPHAEFKIGFDDYLIVFATSVAIAECISGLIYGAPYGLGRHIQAVSAHELQMYMMGNYIFSHFYDVAIGTTKLSILALYYRLFSAKKYARAVIFGTSAFIIAWIVVMEVVLGLSCRPVQAFWGAAKGTCVNLVAFTYFTNITNMVTDIWIFVIPVPIILKLEMSPGEKTRLILLFSIGLATCAITAARLSFVFGVGSADVTWNEASFGILSAWEPCGGILCSNLPIIYRPVRYFIASIRRSSATADAIPMAVQESGSKRAAASWTRLQDFGNASDGSTEHLKYAAGSHAEGYTVEVERSPT